MTTWAIVQERRLPAVAIDSVSGELVTYRASRDDLIIRTGNGERHVTLRKDTPVHDGARALVHADLVSAIGCPAKVRYRDTGAAWIASDVRISCRRLVPHDDPRSF
jgi:hypothetical protein